VPDTVDGDGLYLPHVPLFAGLHVYKADKSVADALAEAGCLLARGTLTHSYPHSWRSKAPLIFRNTPQWFISMDTNGLRDKALAAIDATRWVPAAGRNRLHSMVESRPDWCVSRQRAWGVPITVFVDRRTGEPLRDPAVVERVAAAVEKGGADVWFDGDPRRFLGDEYDAEHYEPVFDILDVWFESGTTHSFVLEPREDLKWPASLYLEGSDQHRGWFHSSLLESCGTRGRAPYEAVLTHGFVLDEHGRKMSKSLGNVVAPQEVVEKHGADVLRLWVVGQDYSEDLRIGPEILKGQVDLYRRIRNTLRYLIGNLAGFEEHERLPAEEMPELERWVLHRLWQLDAEVRRCCDAFDFTGLFAQLHAFCAVDLSAFYFDVRKDSVYCDAPAAVRRRAARTVLDEVFSRLTAWLAPVLCFTAEEAWLARSPDADSVHLRTFPQTPAAWRNDALARKWEQVRLVRRVVTGALEIARAEKKIGSSLQAAPVVYLPADRLAVLEGVDMAEVAITSGIRFETAAPPGDAFVTDGAPDVGVVVALAEGDKCERCWRVLPDVGSDPRHPGICGRCVGAVEALTPEAGE
ncbi:MAG: class I tRNA ligase family protein, partial [Dehalococcoidia bacterium]